MLETASIEAPALVIEEKRCIVLTMDSNVLATLLHQSESEVLDFKRRYHFANGSDEQKGELLKDVLAMANAWKNCDAHIIVGADELDGRASAFPGIGDVLADHEIQQFVSSKTNVPVKLSVEVVDHAGVKLNIITIFENQQRPIYARKGFGKVEAKSVYIRRGSSTIQAEPVEIAEMGKAAVRAEMAQKVPTLALEWASVDHRQRLGSVASLTSLYLTDPVPEPAPQSENSGLLSRVLKDAPAREGRFTIGDIIRKGASSFQPSILSVGDTFKTVGKVEMDTGAPTDNDWVEYTKKMRPINPLGFWLQNTGAYNLSAARLELRFPHSEGLSVIEAWDAPRKPRNRFAVFSHELTSIERITPRASRERGEWIVSVDFGTVQPKAEVWCERPLYFGSNCPLELCCLARVLADDLANPIEQTLILKLDATTRPIMDRDWLAMRRKSSEE